MGHKKEGVRWDQEMRMDSRNEDEMGKERGFLERRRRFSLYPA